MGADEKISRTEALRIFTANNAYATFEEKVKGSIEPDKLADFVIISQDIMTVPDDQILGTHVLATYVEGAKSLPRKTRASETLRDFGAVMAEILLTY